VANAFVAFQTFRHEWGYYEVMLIYWVEVVILGFCNVLRMLVVGVIGAAPLGAWAARWVDPGSTLNRFGLTAIGLGFFVVKFGAFALTIGLFVLLLPAFLAVEGDGAGAGFHRALTAAGPGFLVAAGVLPGVGRHATFAGVMVLLKLGVDAVSHVLEHRRLATERTPA
jgi:hypothetical protein